MKISKLIRVVGFLLLLSGALLTGCTAEDQNSGNVLNKVKVGVIYFNSKNDGGWSEAHANGFRDAVASIGAEKVELLEKENIPDTDQQATEQALRSLVDAGCNIIFAPSYSYMDTVIKVAADYPNVKFEHCGGYKTAVNVDNYFGQIEQPRYLTGIMAGYATKTNKVGYVAAYPNPQVIRGLNAFTLGVRSVNPNAQVYVLFTMTWYDPDKERGAALSLLSQGCDILAQHQDSPAAMQAAEEAGKLAIGYDISGLTVAPKAYMSAPIWHWDVYYKHKIKAVLDGTWSVEQSWGGMKEGIVGIDGMTSLVPLQARDKVEEILPIVKEGGNAFVFAGPIKDQKGAEKVAAGHSLSAADQLRMDWLVEGVVGEIPQY
jgi:basic membrane protein A